MATIRLHPDDCAKYGVPEVIEFELNAVGLRQRSALEKTTKRSFRWMLDQMSGVPELDEHQNPIPEPVIDSETGEQKVVDGEPQFEPRLVRDPEAVAMFVWMVLWGAGIRTPWDTFDVRELGLKIRLSDGPDGAAEPGKADEQTMTDSETTTTS